MLQPHTTTITKTGFLISYWVTWFFEKLDQPSTRTHIQWTLFIGCWWGGTLASYVLCVALLTAEKYCAEYYAPSLIDLIWNPTESSIVGYVRVCGLRPDQKLALWVKFDLFRLSLFKDLSHKHLDHDKAFVAGKKSKYLYILWFFALGYIACRAVLFKTGQSSFILKKYIALWTTKHDP